MWPFKRKERPADDCMDLFPVHWTCPCGRNVTSPTDHFTCPCMCHAPHSDFLLLEIHCETCGRASDVCVWPFSSRSGSLQTGAYKSLLNRYTQLVSGSLQQISVEYESFPDMSLPVSLPAHVVASCRALRKSLNMQVPTGHLRLGPVGCALALAQCPV